MKRVIEVEFEQLPTFQTTNNDWERVCKRLEAGETPSYAMTEKETRAFYVWALKHRHYRISSVRVADGIFKLSKGEKA